jgi:hypothetical protein
MVQGAGASKTQWEKLLASKMNYTKAMKSTF